MLGKRVDDYLFYLDDHRKGSYYIVLSTFDKIKGKWEGHVDLYVSKEPVDKQRCGIEVDGHIFYMSQSTYDILKSILVYFQETFEDTALDENAVEKHRHGQLSMRDASGIVHSDWELFDNCRSVRDQTFRRLSFLPRTLGDVGALIDNLEPEAASGNPLAASILNMAQSLQQRVEEITINGARGIASLDGEVTMDRELLRVLVELVKKPIKGMTDVIFRIEPSTDTLDINLLDSKVVISGVVFTVEALDEINKAIQTKGFKRGGFVKGNAFYRFEITDNRVRLVSKGA